MKSSIFTLFLLLASFLINAQGLEPAKDYAKLPSDYGIEYQEVMIPTSDGVKLNGWYFKPDEASKKIIIICNNSKGNMADNIELISNFRTIGYHVLTFDYRGYGASAEFDCPSSWYIKAEFEKDVTAAINYVKKFHAKLSVVDIYGAGIGGGLAIAVGCSNVNIRKVIADGPYYGLEYMRKKIKDVIGTEMEMPIGYNKIRMEPKYALTEKGKHLSGILVIIGADDLLTGPDEAKMMAKGSNAKVSIFKIEGVVNDENFSNDKDAYFERIQKFLSK